MSRIFPLALALIVLAPADPVTGPAGVYTVTTTGPTRITSGDGWVKIEWEVEPTVPPKPPDPGPGPVNPVKPPDPGPVSPPPSPPAPTPSIGPLAAPIWVAAVYDRATAASLPAGQQALLLSKTITAELQPFGATWSSWDKSDPGMKDWQADAGTTYPVLLVIWAKGTRSKTFPLPADETAAVAFVKQIRGL